MNLNFYSMDTQKEMDKKIKVDKKLKDQLRDKRAAEIVRK